MALTVLSARERPHPCVARRRTLARSHDGGRSRARAIAARLSSPRSSTSHRALRSVRNAGSTRRRDRSRPRPALGADAVTPSDLLAAAEVPFFEFFDDRGGTYVQHPRGIANAARIHGHIDDLLLYSRRETRVGIRREKCPSAPKTTRTASIALLAFSGCAMSHNIRALAVGTVEHLCNHRGSLSYRWFCSAQIPAKDSRSTDLKHLPQLLVRILRK